MRKTTLQSAVPRPEYPRPQYVRDEWLCLNGEWEFEIDAADSGLERGLLKKSLSGKITVPFCPESELSGVGNTDFMEAVWYRRKVKIPAKWKGKRILLHFQAVDYDATVWAITSGGKCVEVARHRGGFTPFAANLEGVADGGDTVTIVVRARDSHTEPQPRGKQSQHYENYGCMYTRTTGIWQSVWMEPVNHVALRRPKITPHVDLGLFRLEQRIENNRPGLTVRAVLRDESGVASTREITTGADWTASLDLEIPQERRRLWTIEDPHLYDLEIELLDEKGARLDFVKSYAGLRGVALDGKAIRLNGEIVFQRLVLDQGYYPDGILTAPSDAALIEDIELSQAAGFNGARLHQKVFEERFLYHADRLGYLCWGEFADWGCRGPWPKEYEQNHGITYAAQWMEALERDYSHPCIIGWCPLNETHQVITDRISELDDAARAMYLMTKFADPTRPVLDASGYSHRVPETDIYDSHDYEQDPKKFAKNQNPLLKGKPFINADKERPYSITYRDQPYFVSEFGGILWKPGQEKNPQGSWGYGKAPKTLKEFYERFDGLCAVLLDNPAMFGYCYTQLTDVFSEQNGIYTFDRQPKFDMKRIRAAQTRPAAIEAKGARRKK